MREKIITIESAGNPLKTPLRQQAATIPFPLATADQELIEQMKQIVFSLGGVGLAAPQLGIAKNVAVIYIPESAAMLRDNVQEKPIHIIINASYVPIEGKGVHSDFEACYSIKSVMGKVPRYQAIQVSYQDETGKKITQIEQGFYARVLQHEIDHLNGILITDRLTPECLQGTFEEMLKIRRAELPPEKQKLFDNLVIQKGLAKESDQ